MATAKRQVFISSTAKDLAEFRAATIKQVERLDGWKCVNMERFGARAGPTVDVCKELVQSCDVFLGIVGHLYGSCPKDSSTSYTEHEYEKASSLRAFFSTVIHEFAGANEQPPRSVSAISRKFFPKIG